MSTTVIASAHTWTLTLAPWATGAVDERALEGVLAKYGLELMPGATRANEFIAAQDLPQKQAAKLAEELRELGLVVRVVNRTGLTRSQRVGTAIAGLGMAAFLLPVFAFALEQEMTSGLNLALLPLALLAFVNFVVLQRRDAGRLAVAGAQVEPHADGELALLLAEIRELGDELPEHIVAPLRDRAERVAREGGASSAAISALASEVRADRDQRAAAEVDALREELHRARRAAAELRR
ncbi:MAG: hypothetical protein EP330_13515 [Deltaproteobacteria bacterium]|nr:MAG: hypothetical protein EP330_13515 [Deltaproteobacteria bacterium]